MPLVRTVFQPDKLLEVDEAEAAQLEREGLLVPAGEWDGPAPTAPAAATPASGAAVQSGATAIGATTQATPTDAAKGASTDGGK